MYPVILITLAGIGIGYLFRHFRSLRFVENSLHYTIGLMLMVLGLTVGSNPQIVRNLWELDAQAVFIGSMATIGSASAACALRRWLFNKEKKQP